MTLGPAVSHHCHSCKLHPPTPAPVYCIWAEVKKKKERPPNICQMINLTTSRQIRGWLSLTVSSEYITIPGRVLSIGRWQTRSCTHQWNDKRGVAFIHHCLTLTHVHVPIVLFFVAQHRHGPKHLFSWRRFLPFSLVQTNGTRPGFPLGNAVMMTHRVYSIFVWMAFFGLHNPSVLNYSESNCYQTKSQKCYYPVIQSWQLHQSWMVTVIAAKSHFMYFIRCIEMSFLPAANPIGEELGLNMMSFSFQKWGCMSSFFLFFLLCSFNVANMKSKE